jgi:hypothetical protein
MRKIFGTRPYRSKTYKVFNDFFSINANLSYSTPHKTYMIYTYFYFMQC